MAGEPSGTRFAPTDRSLPAWKLWIRFGNPTKARLTVDEGARRAIAEDGRSLLAVGVDACEGRFDAGDAVELVGPDGVPFAKGITAKDFAELMDRPHGVEVIHRDRLVLY